MPIRAAFIVVSLRPARPHLAGISFAAADEVTGGSQQPKWGGELSPPFVIPGLIRDLAS